MEQKYVRIINMRSTGLDIGLFFFFIVWLFCVAIQADAAIAPQATGIFAPGKGIPGQR
jgi:hypothetical protein